MLIVFEKYENKVAKLLYCLLNKAYIILFCIIFKIMNIERTCFLKLNFDGLKNLSQNQKKLDKNLCRI